MTEQTFKVGQTVNWRDKWGLASPRPAEITEIEYYPDGRLKTGDCQLLDEIGEGERGKCLFILNNGKWAYGYQIDFLTGKN